MDLEFCEIVKIGKYVVEYDWNSKIYQSNQKLSFLKRKLVCLKKDFKI